MRKSAQKRKREQKDVGTPALQLPAAPQFAEELLVHLSVAADSPPAKLKSSRK